MRRSENVHRHIGRIAAALALGLAVGPAVHGQNSVLTQHYDNTRSGADTTETLLTPSNVNVNSFGKLYTCTLDASINGQVLYVPSVTISGVVHNVIYAYTSENGSNNSPSSVYAFDADNGTQLWRHQLTPGGEWMTCSPVIDPSTNTIYIVTKDNTGAGNTNLRALDITTGNEKTGSPIVIAASVVGTGDGSSGGVLAFNTAQENSRPGLLFLNGNVYFSTSNSDDITPWHGWLFGYHYDGTQFTQTGVFCSTPNGGGGGIWMGGSGIASDSAGNIYIATGNGTFDANTGGLDYAMCYVKLSTPGLSVLDWYSPHDEATSSNHDLDLGGGGVAGMPGTSLLFGGISKFGSIFLINTANMGHFNATTDTAVQRIDGLAPNNAFTSPVVWNNGTDTYVYLWPVGANLLQFQYVPSAGLFSPAAVYQQVSGNTNGGGLVLSSNGTSNAIVWAVGQDKVVRAYSATNVSQTELWDSGQNSTRDSIPSVVHLSFPMVANGKVYVPYVDGIAVYGLLNGGSVPATPTNLSATGGTGQVALSWTASSGATSYNVYRGTTSGGESTTPIATGVTSTSYTDTAVTNGTTYYYRVAAVNGSGTSGMSNEASSTTLGGVPAAPAGVNAVAGNAQVTLSWSATSGATSYDVYRGTSAGGESTTPIATGLTSTTYTNTGLTNGTTYYFKISAVNSAGTSPLSTEVFATPSGGTTTTEVLEIACGNSAQSPFVADTDFSGGTVSGGTTTSINTSAVTNPAPMSVYQHGRYGNYTYTLPGLVAGGSYTLRLHFCEYVHAAAGQRVFNVTVNGTQVLTNFDIFAAAGAEFKANAQSFAVTANSSGQIVITTTTITDNAIIQGIEVTSTSTITPPPAPTGLTVTMGNGQNVLNWTASSSATSYNVYRGSTTGGEGSTPFATNIKTTTFTDSGLSCGSAYYYEVQAVNSAGSSGMSNEANATPAAPQIPVLTATAGNASVSLQWTSLAGTNTYSVYRGTSSGGESATPIASGLTATSYTDSGLTNGTKYYYEVRAVNCVGTSGASNEVSATPVGTTVPAAPTGLTATPSSGQVALSWTGSTGATSYNVYRGTASGGESTTAITTGLTGTTYTNTGLTNGTSYWYYVKAVNSAGTSTASSEAAGTPSATAEPDLIVSGISWTPTTLAVGSQVVFSAVVKNIGSGATPSGTIVGIQFAIDGNESVITWSDTDTTSLAAGASVTLTCNSGTNGVNYWPATAGSHTVQAWVDDVNRIAESNENNNKLTSSFSVP